jgi:hypothetical protein
LAARELAGEGQRAVEQEAERNREGGGREEDDEDFFIIFQKGKGCTVK